MLSTRVKGGSRVTFVTLGRVSWSRHAFSTERDQDSFDSFVSSITMSLNSLDSKISPHSLHSTNSESSSRLTICTRGCLQGCFASRLGEEAVDFALIDQEGVHTNQG